VLLTLIIPYTLMMVQAASSRVLFGMSKHGALAIVTVVEGVANLVLSILLVRPFGILGDAIGTAIPLTCTFLLFMPYHLCFRLGMRISTFVVQAYLFPVILCAPMAATLFFMRRWFVAHTYPQLIAQLLAGGLVYTIGLAWAHMTDRALRVVDLSPADETLVGN
jgi:O-antigen/teichoic acid export membrane protein